MNDIGDNYIDDEGMHFLHKLTKLSKLNLEKNEIRKRGVQVLSEG